MMIGGCADRLLLFPTRVPIKVPGVDHLSVAGPVGSIDVCTVSRDNPQAFVLHFVGNASRGEYEAQIVAAEWETQPVEIWTVNYPGYGPSEGSARLKSIGPAALAVYDELARRAAGRPIFLSGRSLGTTAALHIAANRPCAGLVLQNPPPLQRMILQKFGWWNLWLVAGPVALAVPVDLNSLRNAPLVKAPAVFLMAANDTIVPPPYQQMVVNAYGGPKRIVTVPNADHNDGLDPQSIAALRDGIAWLNPPR